MFFGQKSWMTFSLENTQHQWKGLTRLLNGTGALTLFPCVKTSL